MLVRFAPVSDLAMAWLVCRPPLTATRSVYHLEIGDGTVDLSIITTAETLEIDVNDAGVDIEGSGNPSELDQENGEIEYRSADIDLEWTPQKLDLDRPVVIDFRNDEFEYRDELLVFEWDAQERQFEFFCREPQQRP